jgi:hypothetical protein
MKAFATLICDEADRNPEFAAKIDQLFSRLIKGEVKSERRANTFNASLPDIYAELRRRGDEKFRDWLADHPVALLKGIIKQHDFDPGKRSTRWKDSSRLVDLIATQLSNRLKRGSAFLTITSETAEDDDHAAGLPEGMATKDLAHYGYRVRDKGTAKHTRYSSWRHRCRVCHGWYKQLTNGVCANCSGHIHGS